MILCYFLMIYARLTRQEAETRQRFPRRRVYRRNRD